MCDDGLPDIVVTLGNDESIIMKQHKFWTFGLDSNSSTRLKLTSSELSIEEQFKGLKTHIDMAVTSFGEVSDFMSMRDKTIFVKGEKYFLFENYLSISDGSIDLWFKDPSVSDREYFDKVMYQKDDSISVYKSRPLFEHSESAMLFDDAERPENMEAIRSFDSFNVDVKRILTSSAITSFYLIPTRSNSFYLFWQENDRGHCCFLSTYTSRVNISVSLYSAFINSFSSHLVSLSLSPSTQILALIHSTF